MGIVLVIDDDPSSRAVVREATPAAFEVLEAADGITGIDLARQHYHALSLVVLDMQLPDLDGRTVCLRLREIRLDTRILPFTFHAHTMPALMALGCLMPVYKPARLEVVSAALQTALQEASPSVTYDAVTDLAQEQSQIIERFVRQKQSTLNVVIYSTSVVYRSGLSQLIGNLARTCVAENRAALQLVMSRMRWSAVIITAGDALELMSLLHEYRVPVILIAADTAQALAATTADTICTLIETDSSFSERLVAALLAIATGEQPVSTPFVPGEEFMRRGIAPLRLLRHFAESEISLRELDVIWLDYQGLTPAQIAKTLKILPVTVNSHWRNIGNKQGLSRKQAQQWARSRMATIEQQNQ